LISRYGLAAHLALTAVAPLVLFPFCRADRLSAVLLWLAGFSCVWLFMEPSRRRVEFLGDARRRVAAGLWRDPLTYVFLATILLAAVRWLNAGVSLSFSVAERAWTIVPPSVPWLPGSVTGTGRGALAAACALAVVVQACRHALGQSARVSFLFAGSFLAGVAGLAFATAGALGFEPLLALAKAATSEASYCGSAFGVWLLVSLAAVCGGFEQRWNSCLLLFSVSIGGCATGLLFYAPAPVCALYVAAFVLLAAVALSGTWRSIGSVDTSKCFIAVSFGLLLCALMVLWIFPKDLLSERLSAFAGGSFWPRDYFLARGHLSEIARKAWLSRPWQGVGVGSFPLAIRFFSDAADWRVFSSFQVTALDGWWQLLAERGFVGCVEAALVAGCLAARALRRFVSSFGATYSIPVVASGPVVCLAVVLEAFGDVSLLRPDVCLAAFPVLALASSALPVPKRKMES
jgi:hypothetical protein